MTKSMVQLCMNGIYKKSLCIANADKTRHLKGFHRVGYLGI